MQTMKALKPDDKPLRLQFSKDILSKLNLLRITFGDGYSAIKQRFMYQGKQFVITAKQRCMLGVRNHLKRKEFTLKSLTILQN
jgi:hypothetical protein